MNDIFDLDFPLIIDIDRQRKRDHLFGIVGRPNLQADVGVAFAKVLCRAHGGDDQLSVFHVFHDRNIALVVFVADFVAEQLTITTRV